MRDNPADERPLALGDLAQAESPELVRAALGRFRRRLLLRGLVLLLAVGAAFVLYPRYFSTPKQLTQELLEARGTDIVSQPIKAGDVLVTVVKIARLSREDGPGGRERYGIWLVATGDSLKPGEQVSVIPGVGKGVLEIQTSVGNRFISGLEVWMSVAAGTEVIDLFFSGVVAGGSALSVTHPSLGTLRLDMEQLNVPDSIWR